MPFIAESVAESVSGVATADLTGWAPGVRAGQISIGYVSVGNGTVALKVKCAKTDEPRPLKDESDADITVDLSSSTASRSFEVNAIFDSVVAESDDSGDEFTLIVGG